MDSKISQLPEAEIKNNLEALLYFFNEPTTFKKLSALLEIPIEKVSELTDVLKGEYEGRGLKIITSNNDAQLIATISQDDLVEKLDSSALDLKLTPAVVETLAVVLYLEKADESTIDSIRGVRSSRTLRKLTRRGYLDIDDSKNYHLSTEALRQLGVSNRDDLELADTLKMQLQGLISSNE